MFARRLTGAILKSCVTTFIFFAIAELLLRGAYDVRALFVHRVPLPYSVGDDYGPVPPWLDNMMILVPDAQLIWRNLPNVRRTYVDIFSPAKNAAARTALLRRFVPTIPPSSTTTRRGALPSIPAAIATARSRSPNRPARCGSPASATRGRSA